MKSAVKKPGASPTRREDAQTHPGGAVAAVRHHHPGAVRPGLSAVKFALDGQPGTLARDDRRSCPVLDSLDGRIARLLDATSKIGAELDSLADSISFGVAPALVLYVTLLDGTSIGWIQSR